MISYYYRVNKHFAVNFMEVGEGALSGKRKFVPKYNVGNQTPYKETTTEPVGIVVVVGVSVMLCGPFVAA